LQLLEILAEYKNKKMNVDWIDLLLEIGEKYSQGQDPAPLEKEAADILAWAYDFSKEYIPLMPDWLCRVFQAYLNSINENKKETGRTLSSGAPAEYLEATLF
jgi:hypothetical protein